MYKVQIKAIGHQLKGAAKAYAGKLIGDSKLMADGAAEQSQGREQSALDRTGDPQFGIDPDRIEGVGHQLRGAMKQSLGKLVGNASMEADGDAELASGKRQNAAGSARDEQRDATQQKNDPTQT